MIETAIRVSSGQISAHHLGQILDEGKWMITAPIELFDHVFETLRTLASSRDLMLITKGDVFEQEDRIRRSGIAPDFKFIEIVSEKTEEMYQRLLRKYHIEPDRFMMVGNSLKSDILPVVALGGQAVYIHCEDTWEHEKVDNVDQTLYEEIEHIRVVAQ